MVMQTSGSISIGQARNEVNQYGNAGISGAVNAGNGNLVKLAGLGYVQTYAWSYWYGKSALPTISNLHIQEQAANVDRTVRTFLNLRTGQWGTNYVDGDNNPGVLWTNLYNVPVPQITAYRYINCYVNYTGGSNRVALSIYQQPGTPNDWTVMINYDDNPSPGAVSVQCGLFVNAVP